MRFLLVFLFMLISIVTYSQREVSVYGSEDRATDHAKIKGRFGDVIISSDNISEEELNAFIKKELFEGSPVKDSIRLLKLREMYYYSSKDDVSTMYSHFRLLMMYSNHLTENELEEENRKVGEAFYNFHNHILAIEFFRESLKYKSNGNGNSYSCTKIGESYRKLGELDSMVVWFERAGSYFMDTGESRVQYINSMGFVYSLVGRYNKAEDFYKKAFKAFDEAAVPVDSIQFYILRSNWASLKSQKGQNEEALNVLMSIVADYQELEANGWFKSEVYHKIAETQLVLGRCHEAFTNFDIAGAELIKDSVSRAYLAHLERTLSAYEVCGAQGELMKTYQKYLALKKSLDTYESKRTYFLELIQKRVYEDQLALTSSNFELKEQSSKVLEVSNARLKRLMWISSLSFLMILAFGVVQIRARRKRQGRAESHLKVKQELVEEQARMQALEKQMAEQEIENKRLELSGVLNSIDRNSTLTSEIVNRLEGIQKKVGNDAKDDLGALLQFIRSQNDLTNIDELLNRNVDVLGGNFKERLTSQFPSLTNSELQLIIYIKLGLSTKEIAQIKNVEPSSVRIFKHRVKGKLELSKDSDLVSFIQKY